MNTDIGPMTEPSGDIGTWLRARRELSGVTLRHIADTTKLGVRTLEALEQNRVSQLPGGIYRRAIVRAYATAIGLDPEETLRAFLAHHPQDAPAPPSSGGVVASPGQPRMLRALASVIGTLIPVVAGVFYFTLSARGSDVPANGGTENLPVLSSTGQAIAMMISVSSPCRLQIVADGRDVLARHVAAGESLRMNLGDDVVLLGDDAGAVHFSINGRAGRTLGESGDPLSVRLARDNYHAWLIQP